MNPISYPTMRWFEADRYYNVRTGLESAEGMKAIAGRTSKACGMTTEEESEIGNGDKKVVCVLELGVLRVMQES